MKTYFGKSMTINKFGGIKNVQAINFYAKREM
jgi:hypothetical protein